MEWVSLANILLTLLGIAIGFVYRTLKEADLNNKVELAGQIKSNKEEMTSRIDKLEENLHRADVDLDEDLGRRIDKLEENSRRDDETVKELIKEAEGRMHTEITSRIRNIVELHSKIEKSNETMTAKHEIVLERIATMEGKLSK
jgi:hypothetical protein